VSAQSPRIPTPSQSWSLVVHGWKRLLHNQRALYVKPLLLFEPRTILSSVPYQLA
jgi:hypothetical protein